MEIARMGRGFAGGRENPAGRSRFFFFAEDGVGVDSPWRTEGGLVVCGS